ncbi:MAG: phosphoribosyltransferase family protein [candidate division WOR-3 bacterium]
MEISKLAIKDLKLKDNLLNFSTPRLLELKEIENLAKDISKNICKKIIGKELVLKESKKDANCVSYNLNKNYELHFIFDINETRITFVGKKQEEAKKLFRLLREQRIVLPNLYEVLNKIKGNLSEIIASLLWQIGAIKVSMGDLRPYFKIDERKNRSPIYIDLKGLPNYPAVCNFIISTSALILSTLQFDFICGIEAGSIALASLIAQYLSKPMFFARREKRYPEAPILEGIKLPELYKKRVLLIDDTIVKGWTKIRIINFIREAGGICDSCFVLLDREQGGEEELKKIGVKLYSLTSLSALFSKNIPKEITFITDEEEREIEKYLKNPEGWHKEKGFIYYHLTPK